MTHKYCIVPGCHSTFSKCPNKVFFSVPRDIKKRKLWLKAMHKECDVSTKSCLYVCEDHFNLDEDIDNYIRWKYYGGTRVLLKPDAVPHRFECQKGMKNFRQDTFEITVDALESELKEISKKKNNTSNTAGCAAVSVVVKKEPNEAFYTQEPETGWAAVGVSIKKEPNEPFYIQEQETGHAAVNVVVKKEPNEAFYTQEQETDEGGSDVEDERLLQFIEEEEVEEGGDSTEDNNRIIVFMEGKDTLKRKFTRLSRVPRENKGDDIDVCGDSDDELAEMKHTDHFMITVAALEQELMRIKKRKNNTEETTVRSYKRRRRKAKSLPIADEDVFIVSEERNGPPSSTNNTDNFVTNNECSDEDDIFDAFEKQLMEIGSRKNKTETKIETIVIPDDEDDIKEKSSVVSKDKPTNSNLSLTNNNGDCRSTPVIIPNKEGTINGMKNGIVNPTIQTLSGRKILIKRLPNSSNGTNSFTARIPVLINPKFFKGNAILQQTPGKRVKISLSPNQNVVLPKSNVVSEKLLRPVLPKPPERPEEIKEPNKFGVLIKKSDVEPSRKLPEVVEEINGFQTINSSAVTKRIDTAQIAGSRLCKGNTVLHLSPVTKVETSHLKSSPTNQNGVLSKSNAAGEQLFRSILPKLPKTVEEINESIKQSNVAKICDIVQSPKLPEVVEEINESQSTPSPSLLKKTTDVVKNNSLLKGNISPILHQASKKRVQVSLLKSAPTNQNSILLKTKAVGDKVLRPILPKLPGMPGDINIKEPEKPHSGSDKEATPALVQPMITKTELFYTHKEVIELERELKDQKDTCKMCKNGLLYVPCMKSHCEHHPYTRNSCSYCAQIAGAMKKLIVHLEQHADILENN